jgi:hypothetical protein
VTLVWIVPKRWRSASRPLILVFQIEKATERLLYEFKDHPGDRAAACSWIISSRLSAFRILRKAVLDTPYWEPSSRKGSLAIL